MCGKLPGNHSSVVQLNVVQWNQRPEPEARCCSGFGPPGRVGPWWEPRVVAPVVAVVVDSTFPRLDAEGREWEDPLRGTKGKDSPAGSLLGQRQWLWKRPPSSRWWTGKVCRPGWRFRRGTDSATCCWVTLRSTTTEKGEFSKNFWIYFKSINKSKKYLMLFDISFPNCEWKNLCSS